MSDKVQIVSPIDDSVVAQRPVARDSEIEDAIATARGSQRAWARVSVGERARICLAMLDSMLAMQEDLTVELARMMGRPVRYGGEMGGFAERTRHMAAIAREALAPLTIEDTDQSRRLIAREPLGVVLVIAPWNYPYLTAVNTIVPALIAGNAVILKAASQTLLTGERFQRAFEEAGMQESVFEHLVMSHAQTEKLIASRAVDHVTFTGSVAGGRAIERAAAGSFIGVGLELGGKDPAYVRADADLDHAIENLVDGAFFNSGQSCCGIERIYVAEELFDRFVDGFAATTGSYVLDDPRDEATTLGPMAQARGADLVREQIAAALRAGARAHIDTRRFPRHGGPGSPWLAPQVLTRVDHQMAVMREESFGPVVGIMPVAGDDAAIELMNDSAYGLTASLWTRDRDAAQALGGRLRTGTVFMNRCDYLDPALVWTGVKDTGRGQSLSVLGYQALTRPKSYHLRSVP
ncbi:MAG: aldehyde dehydrogenase family protein [Geminicoccaceae bacterium]|jgi:acyl-CoA reductase-like NAD-dependent aldehyde dehydrogenase|nr:aldehyde dehydrogenase family protein [Geminicoccaceae bacterium]